jgi:hypothetical protein
MSRFFANILNRNLGTCEVVQPRPLARFEPESADPTIKSAVDHSEASEIGGNELTRQDSVVRSPENNPVVSDFPLIQPEGIDTAIKLPVGSSESGETRGEQLKRQDRQFRPAANNSVLPEVSSLERDRHSSTPLFQEQDKPITKPKPAEQPSQVVTENQRPLSEDLPKRIADSKLNEIVIENTSERGYRFENELDNRTRATLARLQDRQKVRPTEHPETNNLPRPIITKPDHADVPEKDQTVRPLSSTILFDEPEKVGPSASDQEQQQAIASTDRDMPWSGSLEPPSWLSEMQTEFNQRWNELNRRSEPEPVINVTIGRVEVRAVQVDTPKQTKRQKKPSGVMSLDEYLNQRERRG